MKSRFNDHSHDLHRGQFRFQDRPHTDMQLPRPSFSMHVDPTPRWNHAALETDQDHCQADTEHEISVAELNEFCLSCIEQLSSAKQNDSKDAIITNLISKKLPSYHELKLDLEESRQRYQEHHCWTKQMYHAVEPLLQQKTEALSEQQTLNQLTLQCVEKDLQLQYRVEQLSQRICALEQAVPQHLLQIGKEIGLPEKIMVKLAKLIVQAMQR